MLIIKIQCSPHISFGPKVVKFKVIMFPDLWKEYGCNGDCLELGRFFDKNMEGGIRR